jgi:putative membrane protein
MKGRALIAAGLAVLAFAWLGPLPHWVPHSFAAHMLLHMTVVGIGVPLVAIGIASRARSLGGSAMALPIAASVLDLVVVWLWHAPFLHSASRSEPWVLALEQASFAGVALVLWLVAFTGPRLSGAITLFFTSMHMTLLGALLGLANRPIYSADHHGSLWGLDALADQEVGGVVMLAIGGVIYLGGGLILAARGLQAGAVR